MNDMKKDRVAVWYLLLSVRGDYDGGPIARMAECTKLAWHDHKSLGSPEYFAHIRVNPNFPTGIRGLAVLACCGAFANLVQLEFTECQLGNVGVARLVASVLAGNALPRLQHLSLRNNGIGDAGWNTLAAAIGRGCSLGNLQTCDFSQNDISDAVLTTLKAALATVPAMRTMFYSDADGRVCHSLTVARAS